MYAVYALLDPDEIYKVCYIGISSDIFNRFYQHLRDADSNSSKAKWLKGLPARNRVPYCKVLEDVLSLEYAKEREAYWIHFYKQLNMPLTNSDIPWEPPTVDSHIPYTRSISYDYQKKILDLFDQGMSGRAIEKMLKEKRVNYHQIQKTLNQHRPHWNKNVRNIDAANETHVQHREQ